jgi:hypothetical protein
LPNVARATIHIIDDKKRFILKADLPPTASGVDDAPEGGFSTWVRHIPGKSMITFNQSAHGTVTGWQQH